MMQVSRSSELLLRAVVSLLLLSQTSVGLGVSWDWQRWWTYDGISGPQFWGLINPEWSLCTNGRRQSPINLDPSLLLYDPNLRPLHIDKHRVSLVDTSVDTGTRSTLLDLDFDSLFPVTAFTRNAIMRKPVECTAF
ncbi:carbonic anhydrase-related protein 11-like [Cherax quadricarinatus]|uniref:carbonic anhydrase-related protein 11-like n=1 Tax=Cherax quadricarinatus TaxID=27406 RepID=UPI00387E48DB